MISADTMQVTVIGQDNTWVGIGYGQGMNGVDMNIIEFADNGNYALTDAYATTTAMPTADATQGGTNDLTNVVYSRSNSLPQVVYQRKLKTTDSKDAVLVQVSIGLTRREVTI
jgi:hypothetical protein